MGRVPQNCDACGEKIDGLKNAWVEAKGYVVGETMLLLRPSVVHNNARCLPKGNGSGSWSQPLCWLVTSQGEEQVWQLVSDGKLNEGRASELLMRVESMKLRH